jgi:hypothetical protein
MTTIVIELDTDEDAEGLVIMDAIDAVLGLQTIPYTITSTVPIEESIQ